MPALAYFRANETVVTAAIVVLAMALAAGPATAQDAVVPLVTNDWPPYVGRELDGFGECSQVVTLILGEMRRRPRYEFLTWGEGLRLARQNENNSGIWGTFPYLMTHERKRDFYFSIPILNVEQVVFYNAAHHPELGDADGLGALAALRPVRIEGYAYQPDFQRIMNDPADADDEREAFELLLDDPSVHYLPFARRVGEAMLARFFPTRRHVIQVIPDLALNNNLHLMVSKLNPGGREFLDDFDDALARLRLAGVIDHDLRIVAGVGTGTIVELSAPPGEWVTARDPDRPQQKLLLPSGTRAALVSWGAAYTDAYAGEPDAAARACLVRVITEPAGGRVLEVDGRFLRLVPGR